MSNKFLPLTGITVVLAVASYLLLSTLFPHKKELIVDTSIKTEDVFGAQVNEADAQPTASVAEQTDVLTPAPSDGATEVAPEGATEVPAEGTPVSNDSALEVPAELAGDAPADAVPEPEPETPVVAEEVPAAEPVEAAAATPEPVASSGLSRDQLAKIVAEAAAQAAAETAKAIAEQATRQAASR